MMRLSTRSADVDPPPSANIAHLAIRGLDNTSQSFNRMVSRLRERQPVCQILGRFVPQDVAQVLLFQGGRSRTVELFQSCIR